MFFPREGLPIFKDKYHVLSPTYYLFQATQPQSFSLLYFNYYSLKLQLLLWGPHHTNESLKCQLKSPTLLRLLTSMYVTSYLFYSSAMFSESSFFSLLYLNLRYTNNG